MILVSAHALSHVDREEFAAIVAHETAHEYVWVDYEDAKQHRDHTRIRELELVCDGIAVLTLRRLGLNPERLIRAFEMLMWYNQDHRFDIDWTDYPSRDERRTFVHAVEKLQFRAPFPERREVNTPKQ